MRLVAATGGKLVMRRVTGPLPEMKVDAAFGLLGDGRTAAIEMAAASGLQLLTPRQRNPMNTTAYGTGELLMAAAGLGAKHIIVGIGGSATTDGGLGWPRKRAAGFPCSKINCRWMIGRSSAGMSPGSCGRRGMIGSRATARRLRSRAT